jgi:hypothetical protein
MPIIASYISSAIAQVFITHFHTIVFAPAAKALVKVECCLAVPQLDIGQPFCNDIQKRRIHANRRACTHQ